jgi:hypothetical protein
MLDEAIDDWGLPELTVIADSGYGDVTAFRLGLEERGLRYVLAVSPTLSAHPADAVPTAPPPSGRGRPPVRKNRDKPSSLGELATAAGEHAYRQVVWRQGTRRGKDNPDAEIPGGLPGAQHIDEPAAHVGLADVVGQAPGGQPGGDGGEDLVDGDRPRQRDDQPGLLAERGHQLGGQGGFADPAQAVPRSAATSSPTRPA